jgi:hypothetical protein
MLSGKDSTYAQALDVLAYAPCSLLTRVLPDLRNVTKEKTAMTRRPPTAIVLMLALGMAACNSHSLPPTAPTSAQSPAPGPTVAGERWNLTATLRSITGPEACISDTARMTVGQSFSWLMAIERSGESIHLSVFDADDPSDRLGDYEGTVVEDVLTVAIKSLSGTNPVCGQGRAESHVSGRFSGDGRALTAEDVKSLQFSSGETLRAYYDWSAARQ